MQHVERASALDSMLSSSSPNSSSSFFDGPSPPPPKMPPAISYAIRSGHALPSRHGHRCGVLTGHEHHWATSLGGQQADCITWTFAWVLQVLINMRTAGVSIGWFTQCLWARPASSLPPPVAVAARGVLSSLFAERPVCRKLLPAAYACPKRSARRAGITMMKLAGHCSACTRPS